VPDSNTIEGAKATRELTFSARVEVGGRSQPVGPFRVYQFRDGDWIHTDKPPAPNATVVGGYFVHQVRLANTGSEHLYGRIVITVGPRDDRYESEDQREVVVSAKQTGVKPGGPQITVTPMPDHEFPLLPARAVTGDLDLQPLETVTVEMVTVIQSEMHALRLPHPAMVVMRGVSVIENEWGWERSPVVSELERVGREHVKSIEMLGREYAKAIEIKGREHAEAIAALQREHADTLAASDARHAAVKRRERIVFAVVAALAFSGGAFREPLARFFVRLLQGSAIHLVVGVAALAVGAVAASVTAGLILNRGRTVLRQRLFWVCVVLTVFAAGVTVYLGQPPAH